MTEVRAARTGVIEVGQRPTSIRPLFRCQGAPLPRGGAAGTRSLGRLVPLVPPLTGQRKAEGFRGGAPRYRCRPATSTRGAQQHQVLLAFPGAQQQPAALEEVTGVEGTGLVVDSIVVGVG